MTSVIFQEKFSEGARVAWKLSWA